MGKLISIKDGSGNDITSNTASVGYKNPYRYRGYRYNSETGMYYLQSRYYNPEWGRFINADALGGTIGELLSHNVFAYCENNLINGRAPFGFKVMFENEEEQREYEQWLRTQRQVENNTGSLAKAEKLGPTGEPNSHGLEYDKDGKLVKERWYGPDGRPVKDRHYTNHGNPKKHPKVPHDHDWGDVDGNWQSGPWYSKVLNPVAGIGLVLTAGVGLAFIVQELVLQMMDWLYHLEVCLEKEL